VTFIALLEDYLSGLTRCERSGQNSKDHRRDPYHVVSDYWVYHCEYFRLIDLQIVLHLEISDHIGCKLALIGRADRISSQLDEEFVPGFSISMSSGHDLI
jgi:hypothetical protein